MYIIDKNKDYYDYLSHVYGVDTQITFDRRGSIVISDEDIYNLLDEDIKHGFYKEYRNCIVLEIGNVQYLILVYNFKFKRDINYPFKSLDLKRVYTFRNNTHYFDSYISIKKVNLHYYWRLRNTTSIKKYAINDNFNDTISSINERGIDLPILASTKITSIISADEIWKEMQNYISSLNNDKDVGLPMTDVEKAEIHGFDKKISFRHPIK